MMKRFTLTVASLLMGMTAVMAQNTKWQTSGDLIRWYEESRSGCFFESKCSIGV